MFTAILAAISILILGAIAKALSGDWLHPSTIFCGLWGLTCLSAVLIAPEDMTSGSGPLWILLNAALVVAGGIAGTAFACTSFGRRRVKSLRTTDDSADKSRLRRRLRRLTLLSTVLGLLYVLLMLSAQGVSIGQLLTLRGLGQTALMMSVERYSHTTPATGVFLQLLLSVIYLAPLLGGTLFFLRERRSDALLAFASMLPALASFASQSARAIVLYGLTTWMAGFLTVRVYSGARVRHLNIRRGLFTLVLVVVAMAGLLKIGDALRGGMLPSRFDPTAQFLSSRVKNYLCGHFGALSYWMDHTELSQISPSWGKYSFAGVYDMLSPGSRALGVFSDFVILPTGPTNVYTYFRALIEDATLPGSVLVIFLIGFSGGFFYRKVSERSSGWNALLAPYYAWIIFGITSLFNYNSMLLAFVLYALWWWEPWRLLGLRFNSRRTYTESHLSLSQ